MTSFDVVATRLAIAIVLDALALTIWDVGTRPPSQLVRDVTRGGRRPRSLAAGLIRFLAGAGLLILAGVIARPVIPSKAVFTIVETGSLLVALLVEALIGPDLRRLPRR